MAGRRASPKAEKRLRITGCSPVYHGTHDNGVEFTIYEVVAVGEDGRSIGAKLRSFEELPVGETLDVLVSKYESQKYGVSFTLSRKNKVGTRQLVEALTQRVEQLAARVAELELADPNHPLTTAPDGGQDGTDQDT